MAEIVDRIAVMRIQEKTRYCCSDYLLKQRSDHAANAADLEHLLVDEHCREKICQWFFRVVDHFKIEREVVSISISYLDRFMSSIRNNRDIFKLAAISSLYLAVKVHEPKRVHTMSSLLPILSRERFTMQQIVAMERIILRNLSWQINPPTPTCFVSHFLALLSPDDGVLLGNVSYIAHFFTELSVFDYFFVSQPASLVAFTALLNSVECVNVDDVFARNRIRIALFAAVGQVAPDMVRNKEEIQRMRSRLWNLYEANDVSHLNGLSSHSPDCVSMAALSG